MEKKATNRSRIISAPLVSSLKSTLFVVGTALIVFVAARNSITWHLQRFWGASGDFWQRQYEKVYNYFEGNEFMIAVVGTFVISTIVYWIAGGLYTILDLTQRPNAITRYKIQPNKNTPLDRKRFAKVIAQVLFNQFVIGTTFIALFYPVIKARGFSAKPELPTFQWVLLELAVFSIVEEIGFYYFHRLLHHPRIYKNIHKQHHEWTAPIAVTAEYCHPVEHILSNILPIFLGPLIMGSHIATWWLWSTLATLFTLNAHCGYHLPFLPSPEAHDYHHLK
jgi:sterol desaturase/sphingolipid hydroxylase (fatty acid hydroxylase superfamily)